MGQGFGFAATWREHPLRRGCIENVLGHDIGQESRHIDIPQGAEHALLIDVAGADVTLQERGGHDDESTEFADRKEG